MTAVLFKANIVVTEDAQFVAVVEHVMPDGEKRYERFVYSRLESMKMAQAVIDMRAKERRSDV